MSDLITRYRKKPIEVEAVKWDESADALKRLQAMLGENYVFRAWMDINGLNVKTIDRNEVWVPKGAYVVLDTEGWPYPCAAKVFEATHEPIAPSTQENPQPRTKGQD